MGPTNYINISNFQGYTINVDERYTQIHNRIANIFVAGTIANATDENKILWNTISESFFRVFKKRIDGQFKPQGGKIGLILEYNEISNFSTLSSGEQEFLSLVCDIITEPEVDLFLIDEIDLHFHPDLQMKVLSEIEVHLKDRILISTTHSPYVMLATKPGKLFYLKHYSEIREGENQLINISASKEISNYIFDLFGGFNASPKIYDHISEAMNSEIEKFSEECLNDSESKDPEVRDVDPQVTNLRTLLLNEESDQDILEIGAGKGRLLKSFNSISESVRLRITYTGLEIFEPNFVFLNQFCDKTGLRGKLRNINFIKSLKELEPEYRFSLCVLANVIHEVDPRHLAELINNIFRHARIGSKLLILEALELQKGESNFVSHSCESLRKLFQKLVDQDYLEINDAVPFSFHRIPLLEMVITVKADINKILDESDITGALMDLSNQLEITVARNIDGKTLNPHSLAFIVHNLANVRGYLKIFSEIALCGQAG